MSEAVIPLREFDEEMAGTRRLLERVPAERGAWKPHDKSFPLGHLAQLVARMPGWIAQCLRQDELNMDEYESYSLEPTATLLEEFDRNVRAARTALEEVTGAELDETWSLVYNGESVWSSPRGEVTRNNLNHLIHHRGQLTVYLRLVDVPLPQLYGPTADEPWGGAA